jgi:hypothetical protein
MGSNEGASKKVERKRGAVICARKSAPLCQMNLDGDDHPSGLAGKTSNTASEFHFGKKFPCKFADNGTPRKDEAVAARIQPN